MASDGSGHVETEELAHNSIGFYRSLAQPVALQAPVLGAALLTATIAGITGASGPLSFILGIVAGLLLASIFAELARSMASAGAVYAYMGLMAGIQLAFVVGWMYVTMMVLFWAGTISATADFFNSSLSTASTGASVPWILVAVVVWGLTLFLISRRISLSTAFLFALEAAGSVLVVIVGIIVLSKGGYHGTHFGFQYFTFAGVSPSSVFLGIVIAFLGFGGFEAAAIFGEEAQTPRSVIPRTMILAVLFSGSIYVFASWFESVGFKSTAALATNPSPLVAVTLQYVGRPVAVVLGLAAAVSAFSATIANANQGSRYLFSLFRDGFISRRFANVSPGQKAPIAAILVLAVPALILSVAFFWTNPGLAFSYVAGVGGIMYTAIYLIVALVSIPWFVRRAKYGYTAVSVLAAGIVGYALYSSLIPAPPYPFNILPYGALVLIIIGIAIVGLSPQLRDSLRHSPTFKIAETGSDIPGAPSGVDA